jgi:iron-sulfur cluster assembly protein
MVEFTPAALAEARRRIARKDAAPVVRVLVKDGGCAGRRYVLRFGGEVGPEDAVREQDGVQVVCATADLDQIGALRVDHVDALVDGGFRYENPAAASTCGCGRSFKPLQTLGFMS